MPAISLAAVPGRRHVTVELAAEIERRGFRGIFCGLGSVEIGSMQGSALFFCTY